MLSQSNGFSTWKVEGHHYAVSFIASASMPQEEVINLAIQSGYVFEWERDSLQAILENADD